MWFLNAKNSMSHHENSNYQLLLQNKQYSYTWLKTKNRFRKWQCSRLHGLGWAGPLTKFICWRPNAQVPKHEAAFGHRSWKRWLSENQVIREGRSYQQDWLPSKQRGLGHRELGQGNADPLSSVLLSAIKSFVLTQKIGCLQPSQHHELTTG